MHVNLLISVELAGVHKARLIVDECLPHTLQLRLIL